MRSFAEFTSLAPLSTSVPCIEYAELGVPLPDRIPSCIAILGSGIRLLRSRSPSLCWSKRIARVHLSHWTASSIQLHDTGSAILRWQFVFMIVFMLLIALVTLI